MIDNRVVAAKENMENATGEPRVSFYTLGCKVNQYETEALREKFAAAGYRVDSSVADENQKESVAAADVFIINTCTVTNLADRKSRQYIRRAKRENPEALIVVTGCYAQIDPEAVAAIEGVDLIVGTNEKQNIVSYVGDLLDDRGVSRHVLSYDEINDYCSDGIVHAIESRTRAYVKIQEGCNRFCTYCIIPYARGKVRSRDEAEILEEVRGLVEAGFKEIVLTGINTALYGAEHNVQTEILGVGNNTQEVFEKEKRHFGLSQLLKKIDDIPGNFRIRLSSLEPTVVSPEDVESILDSKRLCPHLHLSIQSGSDNVLRMMNRRYTRSEYLDIVKLLRNSGVNRSSDESLFGITTDIIVGFPGETEEDFLDTLDLVRNAGFSKVHVFRYSPRKGTKAAEMPNQVSGKVKAKRAEVLMEEAEKAANAFMESMIGSEVRVLIEERVQELGDESVPQFEGSTKIGTVFGENTTLRNSFVGYSDNYVRVYVPIDDVDCAGNKTVGGVPDDGVPDYDAPDGDAPGNWPLNEYVKVKVTSLYKDGVIGQIMI